MRVASTKAAKKKTGRRSGWAAVLVVLILAAGGAGWYFWMGPGKSAAASTQSAPDYHTTSVRSGSLTISASGTGSYIPSTSIDLSFSSSGTVVELNVRPGDIVKAGQLLARLDNTTALEAAVASAELQVLQSQKALNDLQQNAPVALAQAYQAWLKAQDTSASAQTAALRASGARCSRDTNQRLADILDQKKKSFDNESISNSGTAAWLEAKNNYETALANYSYCLAYSDAEKVSQQASLQVAQTSLQQAETTYNTLKAAAGIDPSALALAEANLKQAQTSLTLAQENLKGAALVAPIDGTVLSVAAQKGAMVGTDKFITLADLSKPTLTVSIDQTDLSKLVMGNKAEVVFDALPNQTFNGTVIQVNPQLTTSGQYQIVTGLVELDATAAAALKGLPTGLNASVTIIAQQVKNVLLVPLSALRDLGGGSYSVFVVKNGKLALTVVQVGLKDSVQAEVSGGVNEGDLVSTGIVQGTGN